MSPALETSLRPSLRAETAAELMTPNPVCVRDNATLAEVMDLFIDKAFTAAPVIDEAGHPIGVVSQSDLLIHERQKSRRPAPSTAATGAMPSGTTLVHDVMTPAVFGVTPDTPAGKVIEQMLALNVNRLYVVDRDGTLLGTISALDIVRRLR
jgi:CBS domain-containing protein